MSTPELKVSSSPSPFTALGSCDANACARDRLFNAAIKLFYRNGIRGVSVDAIAAEAGTTKVTFYRVFESKEDVVVQVLEEQSRRFWQWWDSIVARHPGQPRKQLEELCARFCEEVLGEAFRGCAVANAAVEITEEDHPAKAVLAKHKEEKARRLRELCREMGARQPEVLADALSLLFGGAFSARLANEGGREQIATVTAAAAALLDSPLGAPRAQ
jgi:AcrR family transcriptional regulator